MDKDINKALKIGKEIGWIYYLMILSLLLF